MKDKISKTRAKEQDLVLGKGAFITSSLIDLKKGVKKFQYLESVIEAYQMMQDFYKLAMEIYAILGDREASLLAKKQEKRLDDLCRDGIKKEG